VAGTFLKGGWHLSQGWLAPFSRVAGTFLKGGGTFLKGGGTFLKGGWHLSQVCAATNFAWYSNH